MRHCWQRQKSRALLRLPHVESIFGKHRQADGIYRPMTRSMRRDGFFRVTGCQLALDAYDDWTVGRILDPKCSYRLSNIVILKLDISISKRYKFVIFGRHRLLRKGRSRSPAPFFLSLVRCSTRTVSISLGSPLVSIARRRAGKVAGRKALLHIRVGFRRSRWRYYCDACLC